MECGPKELFRVALVALLQGVFFATCTFGRIVYSPESISLPFRVSETEPSQPVSIDIDRDGQPEFELVTTADIFFCIPEFPCDSIQGDASLRAVAGVENLNFVKSPDEFSPIAPAALGENEVIDSGRTLEGGNGLLASFGMQSLADSPQHRGGNFWNNSERDYVGFSFDTEAGTRYGWMGVVISPGLIVFDGNASIFGFAYEDSGAPIMVGDTGDILQPDANQDGDVDGFDFLSLQRLAASTEEIADWRLQYGSSPSLRALVSTPEPATITLLLGPIAFCTLYRSRKPPL